MASSSSWKSSFPAPENMDTKTFTWRLRANLTQASTPPDLSSSLNTARNSKTTNPTRQITSALANLAVSSSSQSSLSTLQDPSQHQFLRFQEFEIETGQSMGLHSMWSLFLVSCGSSSVTANQQRSNTNIAAASASNTPTTPANSDFVGLFLRKILKSSGNSHAGYSLSSKNDEIIVRYKLEIMDREGEVLYTKECESPAKDKLEVGYWDWQKIAPLWKFQNTNNSNKGKSAEQSDEYLLLLRLTFSLVNRRKGAGRGKVLRIQNSNEDESISHEESSVMVAANTFLNLVTTNDNLQPNVTIDIPNRRKFFVHRKVLVERSPVFLKMLGAEANAKNNAVVKVDDISANTMELVLKHIYTGQLEEEWTSNPVTATELIYASEKFGLPSLKEYCNKHLVNAATKNNCYKLMEVAQLHNLEQAAEDLMSYVSEGISSNSNSRKPSEESVEIRS